MTIKYLKSAGRAVTEIGEAKTPAVAARADQALQSILNPKRIPGNTRPVKVVAIDPVFDRKYASGLKERPRIGQIFASALEASLHIGAHLASVTTALSHAKRRGERCATVRGVKFTFA